MKGNSEHDSRNEAVTHEELCALVLGELEGADRARVEAALAASPALAAERELIERTISLVQGSLAGPAALSGDARASLTRAVARPVATPDPWRGMVRAAAALLVAAGGLVVLREFTKPERSGLHEQLAHAEQGTLREQAPADTVLLASVGERADQRLRKLQADHRQNFGEGAPAGTPGSEQLGLDTQADGGTYRGPGNSVPSVLSSDPQGLVAIGADPAQRAAGSGLVLHTDLGESPSAARPGAAGGGDDWFLGFGVQKGEGAAEGEEQKLAELGRPGRREGSPVRDLASTGGGGGPASPGPSGPSTPGPGAPAAPGVVAQSARSGEALPPPRLPAGVPRDGDALAAGEALKGLGYIGSDSDPAEPLADDANKRHRREVTGEDLRRLDRGRDTRAPRELSPAELDELTSDRLERYLAECRRLPGERPRDMYFRYWGDNPFVLTQLDPLSTFGVDVDTASYALARRYLREGHLPDKAQVRTEEFVNYFAPDVAAPSEETFAIHTDLAPTRFGNPGGERWTLRVVLRGKEVSREERRPLSLVFVVDVSGSMNQGNRLALVKHGLRLLSAQLDARDTLAVVAFSNQARVVLPPTSAARRAEIESALETLQANGGTNTEGGLQLGYELANGLLDRDSVTRVVLLSDGVANIGERDPKVLVERVRTQRQRGIYLNTIGVGMGNHNDALLEQFANAGDGICNYVDDEREARRALVENFTGTMVPIARDVKVQVEFDPTRVRRFRQLGYENRAIAHQDFRNDAVDAGEIGAGHQVVALYELELATLDAEAPLGVVRLRWKEPTSGGRDPLEDDANEVERKLFANEATAWEGASLGYRRAVVVAQFAEFLRRSTHARAVSLDEVLAEGARLATEAADAELVELVSLMERSRQLVLDTRLAYGEFERCLDLYRFNCILRAEFEALGHDSRHARILELEHQNAELRRTLSDLLRSRLLLERSPR